MIFNQIKYERQNNNIEITENILSSVAGDRKWHAILVRLTQYQEISYHDRFFKIP